MAHRRTKRSAKKAPSAQSILSHQPWKVSSEELKGLKSYWTLPELCEVAVVVVHYNKLCIIEESLKNVVMVETNFDNGVDDSTQESLMKSIEEIENWSQL